jgi:hypothetical protein
MAESTALDTLAIWAYWILSLLIVGTMCYILYTKGNKQVAAVLTFLISMLALYYYYVKWFIVGDAYKESPTVCPDFMSVLSTYGTNTNQFVCYDSGNVYNKAAGPYANKSEATAKFSAMGKSGANNGEVLTDGFVITPDLTNASNLSTFCGSLKSAGMSWISACKAVGA